MVFYGEGTVTTPRYNIFTNNQFGSEATGATAAATIRHTVIKAAPSGGGRNEMIAGVQTTGGVLYIQRWNGTSWSNEWNVTVGDSNLPRFDIAYEQNSGRAVVAYSGNVVSTNELQYRTYNGSSWTGATNLDASRTAGTVDAIQLEPRPGSNEIGLAWADNLWDLSANFWDPAANSGAGGWVGEPAATLSANVSRVGAPAACTTTTTCMTTWSFDLAFETTSGELVVGWGTEAASDPTFRKRTTGAGGAWSGSNVAGATAVEEATDMELTADPNSNFIGYANMTGESTATAASPDQEAGMWTGDTDAYAHNNNGDTGAGLVESGTNNVTGAWVRNGTTDVFVLVYDDAAAAVNFRYFNKNTSAWAAGTDFTGATAPAAAQKVLRSRSNPFDASKLMLTIVDSASDVFTKELTYGGGTTFTWVSKGPSNGTAAHELTGSSITGMSADYAYYKYIPPPTFDQSAYRWFANVDGPAAFDTDGVVDGVTATGEAYAVATDATHMYVVGNNEVPDIRVEKRSLSTGALDTNFGGGDGIVDGVADSHRGYAITIDSTYMYVVGHGSTWYIEKRLLSTGALCTAANCGTAFDTDGIINAASAGAEAIAITIDSTYMYVGGYDSSSNFRIEKRLLSTGALCTAANCGTAFDTDGVVDGVTPSGVVTAITHDGTYMYAAGYDDSVNWRIEKRLLSTGALDNNFDTDGVVDGVAASNNPWAIATDGTHLYVAGDDASVNWRIEKRLLSTGALDNNFDTNGVVDGVAASNTARAIAIDGTHMYVTGDDASGNWRIEKRSLSTGAVDNNFDIDGIIDGVAASVQAYGATINGNHLYVAGDDSTPNWRIEKRSLSTGGLAAGSEVGSPLAALNTAATAPAQGTPFRLRMNLHLGGNDLAQSGQQFKLQYAGKGGGSCATPTGTPSTYTDLSGLSSSSAYAGTAFGDSSIGSTDWTAPDFATGATDTQIATSTTPTYYLKTTNYGFSIPTDVTVTGISVTVHKASISDQVQDAAVRIVKNGTIQTTDRSKTDVWSSTFTDITYGSASDLWGTTWTPSDINNSNFGFAIAAAGSDQARIDSIRITVHYSSAAGIQYYDNSVPADGSAFTTNANDPTHSTDPLKRQTYEESNNFTNSQSALTVGDDGMWDFALVDSSAPASTTYCLRAVKSDGTALSAYSNYAEITTAAGGGQTGPTIDDIMRHGNWFSSGSEQSFFWADLGL